MKIENLEELLLTVQKPGRYVGGEWNAVKKEWSADRVKVLLAFPDVYEIGMSYLGTKILYGVLNDRDDCLCERIFSPWPDFEGVMRKNRIAAFSLESRRPMKDFDIIGFSLAYELTFTNVLNLLDLGGVPAFSSERTDNHPLVIAGGPSCYNPEPMSAFIDAFVIGDGEETAGEIIEVYKKVRKKGSEGLSAGGRKAVLKEISRIKGVYVPEFYKAEYNLDGTIRDFLPVESGVASRIEKSIIKNLDEAPYPTKQVVPNIPIVHDRIALEIMRGCKHACKFCQATAVYRPCRERSKDEILRIAKEAYAMTGYDEISLLSLSSGDYSRVKDVIEELNEEFGKKSVSVSVPSLRVEEALKELPASIAKVKKSGLTFAPESASLPLRKVINKNIDIEKLFQAALEYYKNGWKRIKLYFMIGLPGEKEEDVIRIPELLHKISDLKRSVDGRPADVTASINAFVPKPHTAFQREAMDNAASLDNKKAILKSLIKSRKIELDFHPFCMSSLEAMLSRGDRRISNAIYEAWRCGCRFDGWQDLLKYDIWVNALETARIDPEFYVSRKRGPGEILPWDFIDLHPSI